MAGTGSRSDATDSVPRIVHTEDVLGGDPRLEGRRIGVYHIYRRHVEGGETVEAIATSYDIPIAAVHSALAYAFSHVEEMRDIEARKRELAERETATRIVPDES